MPAPREDALWDERAWNDEGIIERFPLGSHMSWILKAA